jgi:hypothetical protein
MKSVKNAELLVELKNKLEVIKRDTAVREGAKNAMMARIQKEYSVKTLDDAYALLAELQTGVEIKVEQRQDLLQEASTKLAGYRRDK